MKASSFGSRLIWKPMCYLVLGVLVLAACEAPNKAQREIFMTTLWSQEDTSHNNYRIPSLIVTKAGTLLAFAEGREGGDSGDIDMLLKRSLDNGQTWSDQRVVWDDGGNTCGNPCPVVDQNTGRILLFMTWNLGTDREHDIIRKKSDSTRVPYMTYSDDDGLTWSEPQNLFESAKVPEWGWYATGPGVGVQLKGEKYAGRLVVPCNNSYNDPDNTSRDGFGYGAHVLISDDGGDTWRMSKIITPEVNESQLVELADGRLMMNMRSYHGKASRALSFSEDGGETWSTVQHDPQLVEPVCQGSIIDYGSLGGERMFLFSNPATPFERTNMTIRVSFDDGATWPNSKLVFSGPSAYSSLASLPDGNVGLFYEMGEKSPYERMVFLSFDPESLFLAGALLQD